MLMTEHRMSGIMELPTSTTMSREIAMQDIPEKYLLAR